MQDDYQTEWFDYTLPPGPVFQPDYFELPDAPGMYHLDHSHIETYFQAMPEHPYKVGDMYVPKHNKPLGVIIEVRLLGLEVAYTVQMNEYY